MSGSLDHVGDAVAGEGELAGELAVRVLIDHAADVVRIEAGEHPVHHHLGDRDLAALRLAAGFEIDRFGEALLRLGALLGVEVEPLGRRPRPLAGAGHLALGARPSRRAAGAAGLARHRRGRRRLEVEIVANGDADAERLMSGSWAGGASISTSSSAGQGWMVPTPSPMAVAEIEPPEPHRGVVSSSVLGERRLGGWTSVRRQRIRDSISDAGCIGNRRFAGVHGVAGVCHRAGLGNETVFTRPGVRSRVPRPAAFLLARPRHQEIALEPAVDRRKIKPRPAVAAPARRTVAPDAPVVSGS